MIENSELCENMICFLVSEGLNPNYCDKNGKNILMLYFEAPRKEKARVNVVKRMLEWGVDINKADDGGSTPLHRSLDSFRADDFNDYDKEIVKLLVAKGADFNKFYAFKGTWPLTMAVKNNCVEVVETLLTNGADIEAKDVQTGRTALHQAFLMYNQYNTKLADLLLKKGANRNALDNKGLKPPDMLYENLKFNPL